MSSDYGSDISDVEFEALSQPTIASTPPPAPTRVTRSAGTRQNLQTPVVQTQSSSPTPVTDSELNLVTPAKLVGCGLQEYPTPITDVKRATIDTVTDAPQTPYRLTFGKHIGKTVDERLPDLKAAVDEWDIKREAEKAKEIEARVQQSAEPSAAAEGPMFPSSKPTPSKRKLPWLDTPKSCSTERKNWEEMGPPSSQPPCSSQPTPSKQPRTLARATITQDPTWPPAATQPTQSATRPSDASSMLPPPSSQPTPSRPSGMQEKLLYRFPWGQHKGKTLLDVPESYFAYLELQGNIEHMAGLKEALALFREGKPPIDMLLVQAALDISSSAGVVQPTSVMPSSSMPTSPLPPPSSMPSSYHAPRQNPPETSEPTSSAKKNRKSEYLFDFGIHTGKTVREVPDAYLQFLKERKIVDEKPTLAEAIAKYDLECPPAKRYKLTFGKWNGMSLYQVPNDYIDYLKDNDVAKSHPDLRKALKYFHEHTEDGKKRTKKEKKENGKAKAARGRERNNAKVYRTAKPWYMDARKKARYNGQFC